MNKKSLLAASLTVMVAFSGTSVFANDAAETDMGSWTLTESILETDDILTMFQEVLNEEVSAGTITQEEADSKYHMMEKMQQNAPLMGENFEEKRGGGKEGHGRLTAEEPLSSFKERLEKEVQEGKITQEEADEKYTAMESGDFEEMTREERLSQIKERLNEEVAAGAITQEEADEKYAAMENSELEPRQKEQTIITKEERLALYQKILEKQVEEGTLTQAEADEKYNSAESTDFVPQGGRGRGRNNTEIAITK